jgi:hypothetical protein
MPLFEIPLNGLFGRAPDGFRGDLTSAEYSNAERIDGMTGEVTFFDDCLDTNRIKTSPRTDDPA